MNNTKSQKKDDIIIYILACLIPVIVMVIGCVKADIYPFGDRTFLRNDMYHQYMQFFTSMYDKLKSGDNLAYSMQLGFGSNTASVYAYYLASPLNLLVLLFPRKYIAEFMAAIVIVKMGLSGWSFAYYLKKRFDKTDVGILFFSSAYALSGYMAAYQWNLMWLDVIILAPLVLGALEELIETGKGVKYCLLLGLSIFCNCYLSIMLCIFLVLYFLAVMVWKPWNEIWRSILQFGVYSLLAGGLTGALLVPMYFAMSTTERTSTAFPKTIEWYMNFWEMIGRACVKVPWQMSDVHWPNIYCGAAILLLVPLFAWNRGITRKEKASKLALLVLMMMSLMNKVLDYIWHGFNYPNSMPGRQAYLYTMLVLIIGYEVYINLNKVRIRELFLAGAVGYGVIVVAAIKYPVDGADTWSYGLTLGIIRIYFCIILAYIILNIPQIQECLSEKKWFLLMQRYPVLPKIAVLILVVVELSCNMYETSIRTSSRTSYNKHYERQYGAMAWLKANDEGLFRTEVVGRKSKNDGMMWGVNTTTLFASSADIRTRTFFERVGMGAAKGSYWYDGATPLISAMLGVKYMIAQDDSMMNSLYKLAYSDDEGYLYECQYTLPMGYVVDSGLDEEWDTVNLDPIELQNQLCHLLGIEEDLLVPVMSLQEEDCKYTISVPQDSYVYVYLGRNDVNKVKITVEDKSTTLNQVSFDYLLNVGLIRSGQTATVEGVETERKFATFEAYRVDLEVLQKALDILGEESLEITKHGEGYIEGDVSLEKDGELVISVTADDGWKVYVDGKETETGIFEEMFLSIELEEGNHHIIITYEQPGAGTGRIVSLISVLGLAICIVLQRRQRK